MSAPFTHLHVHTQYSLLDGASRITELVEHAKALGQTSLAITDHGVMYGVIDFYKACVKAGIKPILGMEAYVAPRSRFDKSGAADRDNAHLILLCKNETGYRNLTKLDSEAFLFVLHTTGDLVSGPAERRVTFNGTTFSSDYGTVTMLTGDDLGFEWTLTVPAGEYRFEEA